MNNINSFAENMRKTITAQTNTLNLLETLQNAITTNDTFVAYDYEQLKDGSINTYQLPSYVAITNRLKAIENNLQNLANGNSTLTLTDGSRRQIKLTNLPQTPNKITGIPNPSTFKQDTNWFFEDLMYPGMQVTIDLTGKIDEASDRVKITRIIVDSTSIEGQTIWNNNLSTNYYDYVSLKALLSYNNVQYYEDTQIIDLPLISNTLTGTFQIIYDPEIIDGKAWYTLNTLKYSTIDSDGTNQGNNNTLSIGDRLVYNNSMFTIVAIDQNTNKVRLKILNGSAFPGVYSIFAFYQDPFRKKQIDIRFGAHEYNFIYIKGVNEEFNLLSNEWSTPVVFSSDDLVLDVDNNITLKQYYAKYVSDWGAKWIAEAKERKIAAYYGQVPNVPTINAGDLRVVQINTQINATLDTADIKSMAAEIETTRSQVSSLKSTIAAQKTELQSITTTDEYNAMQEQIATNTADLQNLQASYSTLVNSFQTAVANNQAVIESPKYHIRGFFPIPLNKFIDEEKTIPEHIIGFDIAYRYICEDNTGVQLNTFTYTDTDGNSVVTGTFTDWIVQQGPLRQRIYNNNSGLFEWKSENVADGSEININQIDIPISKGEKVEIKIRSISEAGYPDNPLKSNWSTPIVVSFPSNLNTRNAIADLVEEINDDALNIAIANNLDSIGVTSHLADTVPNINSVNGLYYVHMSDNIAYEDNSASGMVTTVSVQEKISNLEQRLKLLEEYINNQVAVL